jgi:Ca2+-binding EF-hand superfamily protein
VNNDAKLTFSEAYRSMADMGFNKLRAFLLSAMTSLLLAPQTTEEFSTVLDVANSDKTERSFFGTGFDTVEELEKRLDEVMAYDRDADGFITLDDLHCMVDDRTAKMESWLGAKAINYLNKGEWQALLSLMGGRMTRAELRDFYKGSLFFSFLEPDNLAAKLVAYREGKIP